jgi:hypothetical protein
MTENAEQAPTAARTRFGVPSIVIAVVFAVLYAYVLWGAIGDLSSLPALLGSLTPWWLLIGNVVVPVIVYAAAVWLGRRRSALYRAIFLFVGATVISCITVASIAYIHRYFGLA